MIFLKQNLNITYDFYQLFLKRQKYCTLQNIKNFNLTPKVKEILDSREEYKEWEQIAFDISKKFLQ